MAQLISSMVSFLVDEITDNDEIKEKVESYKVEEYWFVTLINIFSALVSFGFGGFSMWWCIKHDESPFEYANAVITLINGCVNLSQAMVRYYKEKESFDEYNKWSIICEVVI